MDQPLAPLPAQPLATAPAAELEHCRYCGAALQPMFYFCLGCASPYKSPDSVVSPVFVRPLTDGELVKLHAPRVYTIFWTYFSVLVGVGIFSALFFQEEREALQFFLGDFALFIATCVVGFIYRQSLTVQLKRLGFGNPSAYIGLFLLVPLLALNYGYHSLLRGLAPLRGLDDVERLRGELSSEFTLVFGYCIFPAIIEELSYRGLIQHWLHAALPPWKAIVFASFLFAITHFSVLSFPYLFLVGVLLGWTRWRTGSLYPSMLIHFLHNFVVIEFFTRGG